MGAVLGIVSLALLLLQFLLVARAVLDWIVALAGPPVRTSSPSQIFVRTSSCLSSAVSVRDSSRSCSSGWRIGQNRPRSFATSSTRRRCPAGRCTPCSR